tara:strand:- start:57 stop:167 length:111 start_codon:yes stop_codon:yes gene_type:complete
MKKGYIYILSGIGVIGFGVALYYITRGKGKSKYEKA